MNENILLIMSVLMSVRGGIITQKSLCSLIRCYYVGKGTYKNGARSKPKRLETY